MALSDLSANFGSSAVVNWFAERSNGGNFAASQYQDALDLLQQFTFGTGSDQINEMFVDTRTVTLATPTDDLDLSGSLLNPFGETISFTAIKLAAVYNRSLTVGENLKLGGGGSNSWVAPFGASSAYIDTVYPTGFWLRTAPITGYAVTAGSADIFRVQHNGVAGDITYDIILLGTK